MDRGMLALIQASDSVSVNKLHLEPKYHGDTEEVAVGKAGDINILTGHIAAITLYSTSTSGLGDAGSVFIRVTSRSQEWWHLK